MRRSREEKARTRRQIVAAAARLFRARGVTQVSVADVMGAVGLTVGGFYRHFPNKEALVAEAIDSASVQTTERMRELMKTHPSGKRRLEAMLGAYLSPEHVAAVSEGCPVAALCSDVGREGRPTRVAFAEALRRALSLVGEAIPGASPATRERQLHALAAAVGGLVLARASDDQRLAQEILTAVRCRVLTGDRPAALPGRRQLKRG
jgi:TetR/AcrR family transcriptional repressor of nem operon